MSFNYGQPPATCHHRGPAAAPRVSALFGFGGGKREKSEKELEKEEAYRVQQEVLARRRNNSWQQVGVLRRACAAITAPASLDASPRSRSAPSLTNLSFTAHILRPVAAQHPCRSGTQPGCGCRPANACAAPPRCERCAAAPPLQGVIERRKEVSKYMQDPEYKKKVDEEKRARFKAKKEQEERDNPVPKWVQGLPALQPVHVAHAAQGAAILRLQPAWQGRC